MIGDSLLFPFLRDINKKLGKRFFALAILSAICAVTDGFRLLVAFLLLPFIGVQLESTGQSFMGSARSVLEAMGIPYVLGSIAIIVIVVFSVQAGLSLTQSWFQATFTNLYTLTWRQQLFQALARARWRYFLDANRGELVNAISQETTRLANAVTKLLGFVSDSLVAIAYIVAASLISANATLLMIAVGLVVIVFNTFVLKRLMRHARAIVKGNNDMMFLAQQFLNNIKAVKAAPRGFAIETMVSEPLNTIYSGERNSFIVPPASRIATELFVVVAMVIGVAMASNWSGGGESAEILLVLVLFMRAYGKISASMTSVQQMLVQLPAFEHVSEVYARAKAEEEDQWNCGSAVSSENLREGIRFDGVTVRHGDKVTLDDLSAFLPPRAIVALVGSSGAGKTTFVDALLRLVDIDAGEILVDGRDIRDFNIQSWRSRFGYVPQDVTLITGSLADNIKLFNSHATDGEVHQAAVLAHAHEFIDELPGSYNTQVGEMGLKLSGGQRQRIAVARALINDPDVLIFDEATSALDSESEEKVMEAIYEMRKSKTIILIAHRLSIVRHADIIIVLDQGRIVEQGNWGSLVSRKGRFSELWERLSG